MAIPTVTTEFVSDIIKTTVTGNGDIIALGGLPVTAHGLCYNTTGNPTTADSKTDEGAASATGPFSTKITGLIIKTKYFYKAYAINSDGTGYGAEGDFLAGSVGYLWIESTTFRVHWIDELGEEQIA